MRQTPPDGIMDVVANPLEKNARWPGEEEAAVSSEAEQNKAIVRRFLEQTMAKGNLDVIDELLAPDFVDRSLIPGQGPTREDFKRSVAQILDDFSTTSFTIEEQVAEGETVVTKYRQSGVQRREIMGVPPTGEEETTEGIYIHRIFGGKITEEWGIADAYPVQEYLAQEMRERERIEQDLRVARTIQQANLPKEVPQLEGWQLGLICQPAREVGGDFYDFHLLSEGRLGLIPTADTSSTPTRDTASPAAAAKMRRPILVRGGCRWVLCQG
jgi:predicted ester cyclase